MEIIDALDATAELCRPTGEAFTNPAKALAVEFAETRPLIAGAGPLAAVAASAVAESLQVLAGADALAVGLPDDLVRAIALLRGSGSGAEDFGTVEDFFRDRVDEVAVRRARLLVIGDDGSAEDPYLGGVPGAPARAELAARQAAAELRGLASELGARVSGVEVPTGSPLARFAAATAFGDFSAAYLALGLGLDPGGARLLERVQ